MSTLLVVGSVAFDSIETPKASVEQTLGGSATFFSFASSFFTKPRLVGVVGEDFPDENRSILKERNIDLEGLVTESGKTFSWRGRYHANMKERDTLEVHLNTFGTFNPELPAAYKDSTHIFLANASPKLQMRVLDQIERPTLVIADTMDLWISTEHDELMELFQRIDGVSLNDTEAVMLTRDENLIRAGEAIRKMGPRFVMLKKGEHGAILFSEDGIFVVPAYPTPDVVDPTGAGDCFAGGLMGYLASDDTPPPGRLRRAMAYGTVVAGLAVEGFGLNRLRETSRAEIDKRLEVYRNMLAF